MFKFNSQTYMKTIKIIQKNGNDISPNLITAQYCKLIFDLNLV